MRLALLRATFVFRTGHHRRRLALGPWNNSVAGDGKASLHVDTVRWMHERRISAFLPDGDGGDPAQQR